MRIRTLRIGISSFVFVLFILTFLGEEKLRGALSETFLFFQFVPSLIQFILNPAGLLGMGFGVILLLSFLFGRVYCSFLCPLGILQDLFILVSRKTGIHRKHAFQEPHAVIRYALLTVTILSVLMGSFALLNLLDPYSLFGRVAGHLFKWAALAVNNLFVEVLEQLDIYALRVRRQHHIPWSVLSVTVVSLVFVSLFSLFRGRAYCNTLCPVGAVLGVISRFSLFGFTISGDACKSCGQCEKVCKGGCIDLKRMEIDQDRCVSCFNCIDVCRPSAVKYVPRLFGLRETEWVPSRRKFIGGALVLGGSLLTVYPPPRLSQGGIRPGKIPVTPPGSSSLKHFTETCTACHLCVSACPTQVLAPAYMEYGISRLLQPFMDFKVGHCDYECRVCGNVCPTGAIRPLSLTDKKRVRIGKASLDPAICVVHVKKTHCGACGEVCPTDAILPVEKGRALIPEVHSDYCIGCGLCEKVCPTWPKAITVTALPVHGVANKRVFEASPVRSAATDGDGFPF